MSVPASAPLDWTPETVPPMESAPVPIATPEELFMVDVRSELSAITDRLIAMERVLSSIATDAAEAAEIGNVFKQFGAAMDSAGPAGINLLSK